MKISKLFHWLYGLVMLLPIFAIGVTCGYAMFNKNAYQSYKGTYQYTEVQSINSDNYIYDENAYISINALNHGDYGYNFKVTQVKNVSGKLNYDYLFIVNYRGQNNTRIKIYDTMPIYIQLQEITIPDFIADNETESNHLILNTGTFLNDYQLNITFNYIGSYKVQKISTSEQIDFSNLNYINTYNSLLYNFISPIQYIYVFDSTLSSVFYHSVDKVTQSNLFNWAYDSFLVAPFSFIVGLFSMPTNSPVVMLLSYWLAISIIWLVFDLVMYVPLLVHRWLDKGAIE